MALSDRWRLLAEALLGPVEFTAGEVARAAGVELGDARRLWQALGFPPAADAERLFTPADGEALRMVRALIDQQKTDPTVLVQLARVTGQSLARIADAELSASGERLERLRAAKVSPQDAFTALVERIEALAPSLEQLLGYVWRRHLLSGLFRLAMAWEGDLFGPTVNLASRLVNLARPGTVLVAEGVGEQLRHDPRFALHHLRPVRLQGIGRVRSWVLRRTQTSHSITPP